jgi:hypothetical protein
LEILYVNCTGETGFREKEFHNFEEAINYYNKCKQENEWRHVEITKQIRVYFPESNEEFID